jgi:hypothetical protein
VAGGLYVLDNSTGGNWSAVIENDQATGNGLYVATGTQELTLTRLSRLIPVMPRKLH